MTDADELTPTVGSVAWKAIRVAGACGSELYLCTIP